MTVSIIIEAHMTPIIVVIEDDKDLSDYLKELLRENDFVAKTAYNGIDGLKLVETTNPHLVLLDLSLPDMNGEGVCLEIKKHNSTLPVIMLTAKDTINDKVKNLSSGADDYVTKPFIPEELIARIKARLRASGQEPGATIEIADLTLDTKKMIVTRGKKNIQLTPQEYKLLHYLMSNSGTILTRDMILNRVWFQSPDIETRVVDVYMGYLRKKIDAPFKKTLIHSIRGFGYTIKA